MFPEAPAGLVAHLRWAKQKDNPGLLASGMAPTVPNRNGPHVPLATPAPALGVWEAPAHPVAAIRTHNPHPARVLASMGISR